MVNEFHDIWFNIRKEPEPTSTPLQPTNTTPTGTQCITSH